MNEKVQDIAAGLRNGFAIPPITVCYDGENYWLQDGSHRLEAVLSMARHVIEAEILSGTLADIQADVEQTIPPNVATRVDDDPSPGFSREGVI